MKKKMWIAVEVEIECEKKFRDELIKENLPYINVVGGGGEHGLYSIETTGKYVALEKKPK
jgi:hypothetical protein